MLPFFLKRFANSSALAWAYAYKVDWDEPVVEAAGEMVYPLHVA